MEPVEATTRWRMVGVMDLVEEEEGEEVSTRTQASPMEPAEASTRSWIVGVMDLVEEEEEEEEGEEVSTRTQATGDVKNPAVLEAKSPMAGGVMDLGFLRAVVRIVVSARTRVGRADGGETLKRIAARVGEEEIVGVGGGVERRSYLKESFEVIVWYGVVW
jgi:hypothetical protein